MCIKQEMITNKPTIGFLVWFFRGTDWSCMFSSSMEGTVMVNDGAERPLISSATSSSSGELAEPVQF